MTTLSTIGVSSWTVEAAQLLPRLEGGRYEIIDGELYVSTQPHYRHQALCDNVIFVLMAWSRQTGLGRTFQAPGLIFAPDQAVAPDVVWISRARLPEVLGPDGKLRAAPDLIVEALSPGKANAERDREKKLDLYRRYGVREYWIADWQARTIEVYRLADDGLRQVQTLFADATLTSPLLPGFVCLVQDLFEL